MEKKKPTHKNANESLQQWLDRMLTLIRGRFAHFSLEVSGQFYCEMLRELGNRFGRDVAEAKLRGALAKISDLEKLSEDAIARTAADDTKQRRANTDPNCEECGGTGWQPTVPRVLDPYSPAKRCHCWLIEEIA